MILYKYGAFTRLRLHKVVVGSYGQLKAFTPDTTVNGTDRVKTGNTCLLWAIHQGPKRIGGRGLPLSSSLVAKVELA